MTDFTPKSEPKPSNRDSAASKHPALLERRYQQESVGPDYYALGPVLGAGVCLGAATYGQYVMSPPSEYRSFLILGGLVGLGLSFYRVTSSKSQVLVGDVGVAIEQRGELNRLLWWEIKSIRYEASTLVLVGANTSLRLPSRVHTRAIRAVLKEAVERLPDILDVPGKLVNELPKLKETAPPKPAPVQSLQITGKRCAVSQELITVERDARLCPNCASVYRSDKLPKVCVICKRELGKNAITP